MSNEAGVKDFAVVNASPIIVLFKAGLDHVLPGLFSKIVVPKAIWAAVTACNDKACQRIAKAS